MFKSTLFILIITLTSACGLPEPPTIQPVPASTVSLNEELSAQVRWVNPPLGGGTNEIELRFFFKKDRTIYTEDSLAISKAEIDILNSLQLWSQATCCKTTKIQKAVLTARGVYTFKGKFLTKMPESDLEIRLMDKNGKVLSRLYKTRVKP